MAKTNKKGPAPEIKQRLRECRRELKSLGVGAFLLSNELDYFYLTGFSPDESAVMVTADAVHIISDGRFEMEIAKEVPWATTWMRRGMLNDEIVNACRKLGVKKLAVQSGHCTVGNFSELKKRLNGTKITAAPPIISNMRERKSPPEINVLKKAIDVAQEALSATRKTIRVGQTELEIAASLEFEMKRRGASGPAFPTICAEGANAAVPHAVPGKRKVKKGCAILVDWGARVGRYCSDLTRMVFVGSIPRKIGEIYEVVLEAQLAGIEAVRPGRRMCDVDATARKVVERAGYGERFTHGLGHGLGLNVHESPSLSWRSKQVLTPGMVVTVEPGIYLPGVGGVRIEDDVLVTPAGHRVLTSFPKSSKSAVI